MNPTIIDIKDFELSGGGKFGESYIKRNDPNILLKLYSADLEQMGLDEFNRAWKVYKTGLPCPEPGELVRTADGCLGILFKRIRGKKSFARALSEHPEQLGKLAVDFAEICKQLHSTKPAPGVFPKAKDQYIQRIMDNPYLTSGEKSGLERYILDLPDADTAVHGDLHHGNVIFTEDGKKYLIDLSEFCTGTPWFDIGIIFRQTCQVPEEMEMELYHITKKLSMEFWKEFVRNYFGPDVSIQEIEEQARVFDTLRILVLERLLGRAVLPIRPELHKMLGLEP